MVERQANSVPNRHGVKYKLFPISLVRWVLLFVPLHLCTSALSAASELGSKDQARASLRGRFHRAVPGWDGGGSTQTELTPSSPSRSHLRDCHLPAIVPPWLCGLALALVLAT